MSDGPEWFAAKRYGYGAGLPISWQGWVVMIGYLAVVLAAAFAFGDRLIVLFAIVIPATALLLIVTARTTRGGWRWRWGNKD
jgi:hypothetical protein